MRPVRSRVPILLAGAIILWAASALAFHMSRSTSMDGCRTAAIAGLACACLSCASMALCSHRRILLACAFAACGASMGFVASMQVQQGSHLADERMPITAVTALQDSTSTAYGTSTICAVESGAHVPCKVRLLTPEDERYLVGDRIICDASIQPLAEQSRGFYRTQGVSAEVRATQTERAPDGSLVDAIRDLRRTAIDAICAHAGDHAALYAALICGHRPLMAKSALYEDFKVSGLAHLVAVSGAHAAIVLALLMGALRLLRVRKGIAVALSIALICAYVAFAGMPISALRSALMAICALTSAFAGRRAASLNSIALCIILFLVADPTACLSVALFLSAGSTLGIVLFAGLFSSWFPRTRRIVEDAVIAPVSLTIASNMVTLPFSAALFSQLSLIAPVANVLAAPLFALSCMVGLIGCVSCLVAPAASATIIGAASLAMAPLSFVVSGLAHVPYASIACAADPMPMIALSAILCILLWVTWPRMTLRRAGLFAGSCIVLVACTLAVSAAFQRDEVIALDVGQGDAILIRSDGASVLVDTGNADAKLRHQLGRFNVHHLDAVIITHPDDDHCASLATLGGYVEVDRICFARDVLTCSCDACSRLLALCEERSPGAERVGLAVGDVLEVGRFALTVIWPDRFSDEGGNADSICLLGTLDADGDEVADWSALFTGDAEAEQLEQMVAAGTLGDIDLLKVGHHGSKASLTDVVLRAIAPEVALVSAGAQNRYGHPSDEALTCLDSIGCEVLRTDEQGSVTVAFAKESMTIRCERGP